MMEQRGLSKDEISSLKASNDWSSGMQVRHAKSGEKFVTTHGTERSSGVFVSEKSLGDTPELIKEHYLIRIQSNMKQRLSFQETKILYMVKLHHKVSFQKWIRINHQETVAASSDLKNVLLNIRGTPQIVNPIQMQTVLLIVRKGQSQ